MIKPILLVTTLAASAAVAQPPAAPPEQPHSLPSDAQNAAHDASEMICRSQSTIGSRVARRRTCATRAQWLEQSRADRLLTERAQTNRTWCDNGAC